MKAYIVVSGEYSDYGIDKVFLDKAKAQSYVKYHPTCRIEDWDISDETYIPASPGWDARATVKLLKCTRGYTSALTKSNADLCDQKSYCYATLQKFGEMELNVYRWFSESSVKTQSEAIIKIEKIAYDIAGQVIEMFAEGASFADVQEAVEAMSGDGNAEI